jgi:hypothetical protein
MLAVPMKTHQAGFAVVVLIAALAAAAGAQQAPAGVRFERSPGAGDLARLENRPADLEAQVAAIAERGPVTAGGTGVARVALVADGAMRRLFGMVAEWKHGPTGEALRQN